MLRRKKLKTLEKGKRVISYNWEFKVCIVIFLKKKR